MDASEIDYDWEFTIPSADITVVLVGKLGYGKSATGNSILGRKAFQSKNKPVSVTTTCEMQSTVLKDGRTVNVIDTPGLFGWSSNPEDAGKEIVKCINMANDGIHAVLMVFSYTSRFSEEDIATIEKLKMFFGEKILDHVIIVFTHVDSIEDEIEFNEYLREVPLPLRKLIKRCNGRIVCFDNKTKDTKQQSAQVEKLLGLVDNVIVDNGGKPFSDKIFTQIKDVTLKLSDKRKEVELKGYSEDQISELKKEIYKARDEQLKQVVEVVEQKLNSTIEKLEQKLEEERAARAQAENMAAETRMRSDEEIRKLKESLEQARRENEEIRKIAQENKCLIL